MNASPAAIFTVPEGVRAQPAGGRPALSTPQQGRVVVDRPVLALWQAAAGRSLDEAVTWAAAHGWDSAEAAAALTCLERAGLLAAGEAVGEAAAGPAQLSTAPTAAPPDVDAGPLVSVVIVGYNSRGWLPGCLATLHAQTHRPLEIIVVDNGSEDDTVEWLRGAQPQVRVQRLEHGGSLARALNTGIGMAQGSYVLLLNPDVELAPDAVAQMLAIAQADAACAAVAAKLRFLWAPAFLNGLGNFAGAFSWGADSALGHLDLGQFDAWERLPSACFAAALIPAAMFEKVGLLDEGFPMYYEDVEWCYRARLLGFQVRAAPRALVYHAFSGRVPSGEETGLAAVKLRRVVYGRRRFIARLLGEAWLGRFRRRYALEDLAGELLARARRRPHLAQAYRQAYRDLQADWPQIQAERAGLQARRACSDAELFGLQRRVPPPLIWRGLPLLTRDAIRRHYLPWLAADAAHPTPRHSILRRALEIARDEGLPALLHHAARALQWRLMQP